jgi:putative Mg2+ transporter-C (MgtC) family protein
MNTLMQELAGGIPDVEHLLRAVIRIGISSILGAVIGIQREHTGKPAGLRTHMLVSMGATLFVLVPVEMGVPIGEVGRVVQGVATGIGFIGGGAILKLSAEREVRGLTTAAGIWMTAAAGVAVGLGYIAVAALGIGAAWLILSVVGRAERNVESRPKKYER